MKSNVCKLNRDLTCLSDVLKEVEKVTSYNELDKKNALRLCLLAEELCGMLPGLVERFEGRFWAESDGNDYELHVELLSETMSTDTRDELIAISKSGKNAAAKGIMGKIRAVAESMMLTASDPDFAAPMGDYFDSYGYNMGLGYTDPTRALETGYQYSWSLYNYKENASENSGAADELERSIVAKLADDIVVGIRGRKVEIVVKKSF